MHELGLPIVKGGEWESNPAAPALIRIITHASPKMPIYNHLRDFVSLLLALILVFTPLEARSKRGEKLLKQGQEAEGRKEWDKALQIYEQALASDPGDQAYQLSVRRTRFQAAQGHVDKGQDLRKQGKL